MSGVVKSFGSIILAVIALVLLGWWIYRNFFDTYHLATVRQGILYRDGVRNLRQFQSAAEQCKIKTVVALVDDREIVQSPFADEMIYCREHGINVVRIPITLGGWPSGDQVKQFLEIANDPAKQPVMVHCAQGVRRTGMMVAAYEMSVLKLDKSQANGAILTFGHSQRTVGDVQRFIQTYDPDKQEMSEELPISQE
jgi:protein tyrosine/serine phosphatase